MHRTVKGLLIRLARKSQLLWGLLAYNSHILNWQVAVVSPVRIDALSGDLPLIYLDMN